MRRDEYKTPQGRHKTNQWVYEKSSAFLIIREMPMKIIKYHCTALRLSHIKQKIK